MTRSALFATTLAVGVGLFFVAASFRQSARAKPEPATADRAENLELVVWSGGKLARWDVRVEVDGKPVQEQWDEVFKQLFASVDSDGNDSLDRKEAERLPSAFGLRQALWGAFVVGPGTAPPWAELDRDEDGKVSRVELVDHYRRAGLGSVLVGAGKPPSTDALTAALLKHLDANGDGKVDEKEWLGAVERFAKLDQNDDELITPGELIPRTTYPSATGGNLLTAPTEKAKPAVTDSLPLLVLPLRTADTYWATALVTRCDKSRNGSLEAEEAGLTTDVFAKLDTDKDGKLSPTELAKWRSLPPDMHWVIRLGKHAAGSAEIESESPAVKGSLRKGERLDTSFESLRIAVRADAGQLAKKWDEGRKRFQSQFADADPDRKGFVDLAGAKNPNLAELRTVIQTADRNGDEKLDEKELEAWLAVRDQLVKSHVLLTVLDHGPGLFELLDANHDGSLSVRELRVAWKQLQDAGCVRDGQFDRTRLPHQLCLTVSPGLPASSLGHAKAVGPKWFQAMDRNGDGNVSRKEFTGPPETFDKLDLDKDGLINPEEAAKAERVGK